MYQLKQIYYIFYQCKQGTHRENQTTPFLFLRLKVEERSAMAYLTTVHSKKGETRRYKEHICII